MRRSVPFAKGRSLAMKRGAWFLGSPGKFRKFRKFQTTLEWDVIFDEREKNHALFETGGFLRRFTHTLNPAVGCVLGASCCGAYCYAQWEAPASS